MNLLQVMRKARLNIDAIRTNDVTSALWSDEEVADAVNEAMDEAARIVRIADSRILSKTLTSSAAVNYGSGLYGAGTYGSEDLISQNYTMFQIAPETTDYLLPPDLVRIVSIRPVDSQFQAVVFRPEAAQNKYFLDQRTIPSADLISTQESNSTFWYTQIGPFGIRFAPTPKDTINIELVYDYRPARLLYDASGTFTVTNGELGLSGTGTDWFHDGMRAPAEFIAGANAVTTVRVNQNYPQVSAITSGTTATLLRAYQDSSLLNAPGALAMIPLLPAEHHAWLAQMTAAIMMRKVNPETSEKFALNLEKQLSAQIQPELAIRQIQESIPVEPFETHRM